MTIASDSSDGLRAASSLLWAQDSVDALVGALVAAHLGRGGARRGACAAHSDGVGGDGSATSPG